MRGEEEKGAKKKADKQPVSFFILFLRLKNTRAALHTLCKCLCQQAALLIHGVSYTMRDYIKYYSLDISAR